MKKKNEESYFIDNDGSMWEFWVFDDDGTVVTMCNR